MPYSIICYHSTWFYSALQNYFMLFTIQVQYLSIPCCHFNLRRAINSRSLTCSRTNSHSFINDFWKNVVGIANSVISNSPFVRTSIAGKPLFILISISHFQSSSKPWWRKFIVNHSTCLFRNLNRKTFISFRVKIINCQFVCEFTYWFLNWFSSIFRSWYLAFINSPYVTLITIFD